MAKRWTAKNIPNLSGTIAVVTGASSGLGRSTTRDLAAAGATVVMACRNMEKARTVADEIRRERSGVDLDLMPLDIADLSSVRAFVDAFGQKYDRLDLLVNNAGVMAVPETHTVDGFEMQIGTNHLGHFALTGLLMDRLRAAGKPRVVTVSSLMHKRGKIRLNDLNWGSGYDKWQAYAQSKLANLLFTLELDRRLNGSGERIISVAAHPGYSDTPLQYAGSEMTGAVLQKYLFRFMSAVLAQSADMGALPTLYAATMPDVRGGEYYGPTGPGEIRGYPGPARPIKRALERDTARKLWELSEKLTDVHYLSNAT